MKRTLFVTFMLAVLMLSGCAKQSEHNPPEPEPLSTAEVVAIVNPSVVQIVTQDGTGSGIIIDTAGHILTNNHIVEEVASAKIVLSDGRALSASMFNRDWVMDLAILKVTVGDLKPATLGSSSEVQLGDDVLTLGFPLDLGSSVTVTKGIVSAFREPYIQTDAPVNPGNSGGPLVNMRGEVIGLVTAKPTTQDQEPAEGIGFAIAIDHINSSLPGLMSPQESSSLTSHATVTASQGSSWGLFMADAFGNLHHVWGELIEFTQCDVKPKLTYSVRSSSGSWSTPDMVTEGSASNCMIGGENMYVRPTDLAIDQGGVVHVVWYQRVIRMQRVYLDLFHASRSPGQSWSAPTCLSSGEQWPMARLALDSADSLHLIYTGDQSESGIHYIQKPKNGTWSQPDLIEGTHLTLDGWIEQPRLTCDSQGNLHLVYIMQSGGAPHQIYEVTKPAGGGWTLPAPIPEARTLVDLQSIVDSNDQVTIAFRDCSPQEVYGRIAYSSLSVNQSWSAIQYLSTRDHVCKGVRFAQDPSGTIYAVWTRKANPEDGGSASLVLRWRTPGNAWSPEYLVYEAAAGDIAISSFVVDNARNGHFLMSDYDSSAPNVCQYLTLALDEVID